MFFGNDSLRWIYPFKVTLEQWRSAPRFGNLTRLTCHLLGLHPGYSWYTQGGRFLPYHTFSETNIRHRWIQMDLNIAETFQGLAGLIQGQSYNPLRQVKSHSLPWLVVSNIFYFHPYLGKIPIFTNIIQMGWNHQLVPHQQLPSRSFEVFGPWHVASHGRGMSSSSRCWWPTTGRGGGKFWCSYTPKFNMQYLVDTKNMVF